MPYQIDSLLHAFSGNTALLISQQQVHIEELQVQVRDLKFDYQRTV